jgi:DNA-binding response OmpR family regulator
MLRRPEETLDREEILENVWGDEAEFDSNVLNVYVNYLRNKIEAGRYPRLIHTVRGAGYMLSTIEPDALKGTPSKQT